jgi:hypothetical protein
MTIITIAVLLFATRIALMFGSDKGGVYSGSKPYGKWEQNDTTH